MAEEIKVLSKEEFMEAVKQQLAGLEIDEKGADRFKSLSELSEQGYDYLISNINGHVTGVKILSFNSLEPEDILLGHKEHQIFIEHTQDDGTQSVSIIHSTDHYTHYNSYTGSIDDAIRKEKRESNNRYYRIPKIKKDAANLVRQWGQECEYITPENIRMIVGGLIAYKRAEYINLEEIQKQLDEIAERLTPVEIIKGLINSKEYRGGTRSESYFGYKALEYDISLGTRQRSDDARYWLDDNAFNDIGAQRNIAPLDFAELLVNIADEADFDSPEVKDLIKEIATNMWNQIRHNPNKDDNDSLDVGAVNNLPNKVKAAIAKEILEIDRKEKVKDLYTTRSFLSNYLLTTNGKDPVRFVSKESLELFKELDGLNFDDPSEYEYILILKNQLNDIRFSKDEIDKLLREIIDAAKQENKSISKYILNHNSLIDITYGIPKEGTRYDAARSFLLGEKEIGELFKPDWERAVNHIANILNNKKTTPFYYIEKILDLTSEDGTTLKDDDLFYERWSFPIIGLRNSPQKGFNFEALYSKLTPEHKKEWDLLQTLRNPQDKRYVDTTMLIKSINPPAFCQTVDKALEEMGYVSVWKGSWQGWHRENTESEIMLFDKTTKEPITELNVIDGDLCVQKSDWKNISSEYGDNLQACKAITDTGEKFIVKLTDEKTGKEFYAHCSDLSKQGLLEGIQDAIYKRSVLRSSISVKMLTERIENGGFTAQDYRDITGACRAGTQGFLDEWNDTHPDDQRDWDSKWTLNEGIRATQGQYGHGAFLDAISAWAKAQNWTREHIVVTDDGVVDFDKCKETASVNDLKFMVQGNDVVLKFKDEVLIVEGDKIDMSHIEHFAWLKGFRIKKDDIGRALNETLKVACPARANQNRSYMVDKSYPTGIDEKLSTAKDVVEATRTMQSKSNPVIA